jgi:hypothetical protein
MFLRGTEKGYIIWIYRLFSSTKNRDMAILKSERGFRPKKNFLRKKTMSLET